MPSSPNFAQRTTASERSFTRSFKVKYSSRSNDPAGIAWPIPLTEDDSMTLHRRQFLRAAGVSLALPCLDVFSPVHAGPTDAQPRRRLICICAPLGLHPPYFFPEKDGKEYDLKPYLEVVKDFRSDF